MPQTHRFHHKYHDRDHRHHPRRNQVEKTNVLITLPPPPGGVSGVRRRRAYDLRRTRDSRHPGTRHRDGCQSTVGGGPVAVPPRPVSPTYWRGGPQGGGWRKALTRRSRHPRKDVCPAVLSTTEVRHTDVPVYDGRLSRSGASVSPGRGLPRSPPRLSPPSLPRRGGPGGERDDNRLVYLPQVRTPEDDPVGPEGVGEPPTLTSPPTKIIFVVPVS